MKRLSSFEKYLPRLDEIITMLVKTISNATYLAKIILDFRIIMIKRFGVYCFGLKQ